MDRLLEIQNLSVEFRTEKGTAYALNDVSLGLSTGENLAVVGESGSGKSTLAHAIMRLLSPTAVITGGRILFDGTDLTVLPERELRALCGSELSMIFQDPMQCLDPGFTVGYQLAEALLAHGKCKKAEAKDRSEAMLGRMGIREPREIMRRYSFQLSGGMMQRVMIAMALLTGPKLLIADEPTTALDVTIQAQILDVMKDIQKRVNTSIIFITHNLGVVAEVCDKVSVMYAGKIVEQGDVNDIFYDPQHPYTKALLASMPRLDEDGHERLIPIEGTPIDLLDPPQGCNFGPRCKECRKICLTKKPPYADLGNGHISACWLHFMDGAVKKEEA